MGGYNETGSVGDCTDGKGWRDYINEIEHVEIIGDRAVYDFDEATGTLMIYCSGSIPGCLQTIYSFSIATIYQPTANETIKAFCGGDNKKSQIISTLSQFPRQQNKNNYSDRTHKNFSPFSFLKFCLLCFHFSFNSYECGHFVFLFGGQNV